MKEERGVLVVGVAVLEAHKVDNGERGAEKDELHDSVVEKRSSRECRGSASQTPEHTFPVSLRRRLWPRGDETKIMSTHPCHRQHSFCSFSSPRSVIEANEPSHEERANRKKGKIKNGYNYPAQIGGSHFP